MELKLKKGDPISDSKRLFIEDSVRRIYEKFSIEKELSLNSNPVNLDKEYMAKERLARSSLESGDFNLLASLLNKSIKDTEEIARLIIKKADERREELEAFYITLGYYRIEINEAIRNNDRKKAEFALDEMSRLSIESKRSYYKHDGHAEEESDNRETKPKSEKD